MEFIQFASEHRRDKYYRTQLLSYDHVYFDVFFYGFGRRTCAFNAARRTISIQVTVIDFTTLFSNCILF